MPKVLYAMLYWPSVKPYAFCQALRLHLHLLRPVTVCLILHVHAYSSGPDFVAQVLSRGLWA